MQAVLTMTDRNAANPLKATLHFGRILKALARQPVTVTRRRLKNGVGKSILQAIRPREDRTPDLKVAKHDPDLARRLPTNAQHEPQNQHLFVDGYPPATRTTTPVYRRLSWENTLRLDGALPVLRPSGAPLSNGIAEHTD
jgi:hypothetical protein